MRNSNVSPYKKLKLTLISNKLKTINNPIDSVNANTSSKKFCTNISSDINYNNISISKRPTIKNNPKMINLFNKLNDNNANTSNKAINNKTNNRISYSMVRLNWKEEEYNNINKYIKNNINKFEYNSNKSLLKNNDKPNKCNNLNTINTTINYKNIKQEYIKCKSELIKVKKEQYILEKERTLNYNKHLRNQIKSSIEENKQINKHNRLIKVKNNNSKFKKDKKLLYERNNYQKNEILKRNKEKKELIKEEENRILKNYRLNSCRNKQIESNCFKDTLSDIKSQIDVNNDRVYNENKLKVFNIYNNDRLINVKKKEYEAFKLKKLIENMRFEIKHANIEKQLLLNFNKNIHSNSYYQQ